MEHHNRSTKNNQKKKSEQGARKKTSPISSEKPCKKCKNVYASSTDSSTPLSPFEYENTEDYSASNIEYRTEKPWLNADGTPKNRAQLRRSIKKGWNAHVWEAYLSEFESERKEILLEDPYDIEKLSALEHGAIFCSAAKENGYPLTRDLLIRSLEALSPREYKIIRMRFWESMSVPEIAVELGINIATVRSTLRNSLEKLREMLVNLSKIVSSAG